MKVEMQAACVPGVYQRKKSPSNAFRHRETGRECTPVWQVIPLTKTALSFPWGFEHLISSAREGQLQEGGWGQMLISSVLLAILCEFTSMSEVKSNFIQRASKKSGRECSGFPRDERQRVGWLLQLKRGFKHSPSTLHFVLFSLCIYSFVFIDQ